MSIQQKREQRKQAALTLNKLVKDHPKDQEWTQAEQEKYDSLVKEIDNLDGDLERHQKILDLEAKSKTAIQDKAEQSGISTDEAEHNANQEKAAYNAWLRGGMSALNEEQRAAVQNRIKNPNNALSTVTGPDGGFLTADEVAPGISHALSEYGGMREMATVHPTNTGNSIPWPTSDATAETGEWLAESQEQGDEDTHFGKLDIGTHAVGSKVITIPFQLLQDSLFDIEGHVNNIIGQRIGRTTEDGFINGNGNGKPHGLLADITAGKIGANGQTSSIILDDLIDLEHSVDPAYRKSGKCGWQMHDNTLKVIKKLKDAEGRPIWLPGIEAGAPNEILGYKYAINQHMPTMAANAKSLAFGDFSKYVIRDVTSVMFFRFTDSFYTKKGQVGFMAWMRSGGRFIDVGGAVKYFQNSAA